MSFSIGRTAAGLAALAIALCARPAAATEGGGSVYPFGAENYLTGALPPPGVYALFYGEAYFARKLVGNDGQDVTPPGFRLNANALVSRLVWVTPQKVLGGDFLLSLIVPMVNLHVEAAGRSQTKTGLGDITVSPGIGWHVGPNLHVIGAFDFFAPTGGYNKNDLANIGRNYWAFGPVYAASWVDPHGVNADVKLGYLFNQINHATGYTSGNELYADYSLGWAATPQWVLGVGGYVTVQTTDDKVDGQTVSGNRHRAFAIGPSIKYASSKGWFVTAKWQHEMAVRNGAQGHAFWIRAVFPL
ncbi:SphA family protein [Burkholderia cenocepacia]|uniref:SphA family protein n=1 Tax=Burkholderia cenocepacia TaxID=95486 RepID=UPI00158AF900|nr:transporter [Burkholderia cenocepacia]